VRHPASLSLHVRTADCCLERQLNELFASLSVISVELVPIHQRLVHIRKQLAFMSGDPKPNKQEYKAIMEELRKIDGLVQISFTSQSSH
jgi:hypothetical protein